MASAGTVTVDFAAETAKFTAELKKVRTELAAVRSSTKTVSDAVSSAKNLLAGYLTVASGVAAIRAVAQATAEAEHAQALLNNALTAAKVPVKAAAAELSAYAGQLQRTTTFSDEAIMQVETLLLSFRGLSSDAIKRATASVLDLSTRMGIDAPAAAKLLGKALADPEKGVTQLARSGVIFNDQQKEQIKTLVESGESLKAQDYILKQLEQTFGGAANAARNTFGGSIAGLKNAFGELLEGKGGVSDATQSINNLTEVLSSSEFQTAAGKVVSFLVKTVNLAAQAAAGLSIIFRGGDGDNELVNLDNQLGKLLGERESLKNALNPENRLFGQFYSDADAARDTQRIKDIGAEILALEARIADAREKARQERVYGAPLKYGIQKNAAAASFVTGGTTANDEVDTSAAKAAAEERGRLRQQELDERISLEQTMRDINNQVEEESVERMLRLSDQRRKEQEQEIQDALFLNENLVAIRERTAEQEAEIQQDAESRIVAMKQATATAAMGLLSVLATRSRTAAKALILINKATAISAVVQNTAAAVMAAFKIYGPTPMGYAQAAAMKAHGATQIGLIAATGALEISNVGAGGGGGGFSTATPNATNPRLDSEDGPRGASSQSVMQVHFNAPVYGIEQLREYIGEVLSDGANNRDIVYFSGNSRQAQEIRSGG